MGRVKNTQYTPIITVFTHIAIWLLIIHLQFNLLGLLESFIVFFSTKEKYVDEAFLIIPPLIGLFYWNSHYLIPTFLKRDSWWKYLIALCGSFLIFFYLGVFVFEIVIESEYTSGVDDVIAYFDYSLILYLVVIGISTSLGISKIAIQNAAQKKEAEEKQKEAELKYLSNQFNPHFLFNTLNGIYALAAEEEATKTTEAILKLSEIMRYPIKDGTKKKVPLLKELKFIEDYIGLQKIRLGENYPLTFDSKGDFEHIEIAPLLFIPIVENAFKYGISQKNKSPISFSLSVQNDHLLFKSENEINHKNNNHSHQTGIQNLNIRLNLLYKQKFTLKSSTSGHKYYVNLQIEI